MLNQGGTYLRLPEAGAFQAELPVSGRLPGVPSCPLHPRLRLLLLPEAVALCSQPRWPGVIYINVLGSLGVIKSGVSVSGGGLGRERS